MDKKEIPVNTCNASFHDQFDVVRIEQSISIVGLHQIQGERSVAKKGDALDHRIDLSIL